VSHQIYDPALLSLRKIRNKGANAESAYNQNRRLILQLIKDAGVISRKSLAEKTGLKLATITLIINELLEKGIIQETGFIDGDCGRKIMGFGLVQDKYCTIVSRISISYFTIGVYDINNENLYIDKVFMDTLHDINKTCDAIAKEIKELKKKFNHKIILGVAIGVEGPFIIKDGYYKMPDSNSPDGYFDIGRVLSNKLELPVIVNRQNNFAVYNLWMEENKNNHLGIFINITVSYTIECGIMVNGEILNGFNGAAGLLGKVTIDQNAPTTLNDCCSSTYVLKRVHDSLKDHPKSVLNQIKGEINIRDVIKAFTLEDELAVEIFTDVGKTLGQIVASITNLLNPDHILLGDEVPQTQRMKDIIGNEARKYIPKEIDLNFHMFILDFESHRQSKIDPCLIGASRYIMDAFIQSIDFTENNKDQLQKQG
jgi:predicted NBD/HSP70 family sugar kinase